MIINKALKILAVIQLILISACTGSSGDGNNKLDKLPVHDIKSRINQNSGLIETLEASGNISFDSPEQSGSGWFELRIRKPDTVFVKIEGPFGISIVNALIARDKFLYYNAQENKAITGPSTDINIGAILRIKITFDELINGFTGGFSFNSSPDDSAGADSENQMYIIQSINELGNQKFYVDPSVFTIQRYNCIDKNNSPVVEVYYSNYQEETSYGKIINFPTTIKINNPSKNQSVYVDYVNKQLNKKDLSFRMKIPSSAKIIKWE